MTLTDQEVHCVHMYHAAHILDDSLMAQKLDIPLLIFQGI